MTTDALLALENLSCGYGEVVAVSGLPLAVPRGQIFALLDLCVAALTALNRDGLTILLVEQNTARGDANLFARYFGVPA